MREKQREALGEVNWCLTRKAFPANSGTTFSSLATPDSGTAKVGGVDARGVDSILKRVDGTNEEEEWRAVWNVGEGEDVRKGEGERSEE